MSRPSRCVAAPAGAAHIRDSLAHVLEVMDWQGYPAWKGADGRR
ncbi:hypothetical protein [Streptomyces sp. NBC_01614]|uniref:Uncharacterized protein n=1 Tax=Streptomyces sp. NBC_00180 TaxID=2903632 RepID=A0AAU1I9P1_9ACTN